MTHRSADRGIFTSCQRLSATIVRVISVPVFASRCCDLESRGRQPQMSGNLPKKRGLGDGVECCLFSTNSLSSLPVIPPPHPRPASHCIKCRGATRWKHPDAQDTETRASCILLPICRSSEPQNALTFLPCWLHLLPPGANRNRRPPCLYASRPGWEYVFGGCARGTFWIQNDCLM